MLKGMNHSNMRYSPNPQHRNGTWGKSQWLISLADEFGCFNTAHANDWIENDTGWGLYLSNEVPNYLGLAQDHITKVFIAKFVGDQGIWHGYPADHQQNHQDIPTEQVLMRWMEANLFSPAKVRKIVRGQPCRL